MSTSEPPNLPHLDALATLAALAIDEEERRTLGADLDAIVRYVEQLRAIPTDGVPPMTTVEIAARVPLRGDVPRDGLTQEEALANAPAAAEGGFSVPTFVGS